MWCGKKTTGKEPREHIFPNAILGTKCLLAGDVCRDCNQKFGNEKIVEKWSVDGVLKHGHPAMMHAYQVDPKIRSKGKQNREKKLKQKIHIEGINGTKILRNNNSTSFIDANFSKYSDSFSRSLHKCIANIICSEHGSKFVRGNCKELLEFVKNGGDARPWRYAVSYSGLFNKLLIGPAPIKYAVINAGNTTKYIVSFTLA